MAADEALIRAAGHNISDGGLDRQGADECTSHVCKYRVF